MKKKSSSKLWLRNHFRDLYVKEAHKKNIRSRAWFKIKQIHKKFHVFKLGNIVVDIGCFPGSWSQYAIKQIGLKGKIVSCDIKYMKPISKVKFIQGDVKNNKTISLILNFLKNKKVNVVMSDLSPKTTGYPLIDVHESICLSKIVFNLSIKILSKNGFFITKVFQGDGFDLYIKCIKKIFFKVQIYKPHASKLKSREIFIIAKNIKK
ncbi:Ribosomal RNA large subunit methyltransferase E [Buchnera aphidicola (Periphyllus testudinaceus)]|uniref:RlmE family RNA methyltransferase n=1 Tax=Buchnera aphidicola TaxID=9 RepID=UPI003464A85B